MESSAGSMKGSLLKYAVLVVVAVVLVGCLWQVAWSNSGSDQWEALPEKKGVELYSLKVPGSSLIQYKAVMRFQPKGNLAQIVNFMHDITVCQDVGCHDGRVLETIDSRHDYKTFIYDFPAPFKPRQYVVLDQVTRDPRDNSVLIEYLGVPYKIPLQNCCVRVPHFNNKWKFTPQPDGWMVIEFTTDSYEGGMIPAFYSNSMNRKSAYAAPRHLVKLLNSDKYLNKYQGASLDFFKEAAATP